MAVMETPLAQIYFSRKFLASRHVDELDSWTYELKLNYADVQVMLEIERRKGVGSLDFYGGLFHAHKKIGQILQGRLHGLKKRHPDFVERGLKVYTIGCLRYARTDKEGYFLTDEGENHLSDLEGHFHHTSMSVENARSDGALFDVLNSNNITPGEYIVQRELFVPEGVLLFRKSPDVFSEPFLGSAIDELLSR